MASMPIALAATTNALGPLANFKTVPTDISTLDDAKPTEDNVLALARVVTNGRDAAKIQSARQTKDIEAAENKLQELTKECEDAKARHDEDAESTRVELHAKLDKFEDASDKAAKLVHVVAAEQNVPADGDMTQYDELLAKRDMRNALRDRLAEDTATTETLMDTCPREESAYGALKFCLQPFSELPRIRKLQANKRARDTLEMEVITLTSKVETIKKALAELEDKLIVTDNYLTDLAIYAGNLKENREKEARVQDEAAARRAEEEARRDEQRTSERHARLNEQRDSGRNAPAHEGTQAAHVARVREQLRHARVTPLVLGAEARMLAREGKILGDTLFYGEGVQQVFSRDFAARPIDTDVEADRRLGTLMDALGAGGCATSAERQAALIEALKGQSPPRYPAPAPHLADPTPAQPTGGLRNPMSPTSDVTLLGLANAGSPIPLEGKTGLLANIPGISADQLPGAEHSSTYRLVPGADGSADGVTGANQQVKRLAAKKKVPPDAKFTDKEARRAATDGQAKWTIHSFDEAIEYSDSWAERIDPIISAIDAYSTAPDALKPYVEVALAYFKAFKAQLSHIMLKLGAYAMQLETELATPTKGTQLGPTTRAARQAGAAHLHAVAWDWVQQWAPIEPPGLSPFQLAGGSTAAGAGSFIALEFNATGFQGATRDGHYALDLSAEQVLQEYGWDHDWAVDAEFNSDNTCAALLQLAPLQAGRPAILVHAQGGRSARLPPLLLDWLETRRLYGWGVSRDVPCIAELTGLSLHIEDGADELALRIPGTRRALSLATATALLAAASLSKEARRSDWAAASLSAAAWEYAATDAFATAACWRRLRSGALPALHAPPPPQVVLLPAQEAAGADRGEAAGDDVDFEAAVRAMEAARPLGSATAAPDDVVARLDAWGLEEAELRAATPPSGDLDGWFTHTEGGEQRKLRRQEFIDGAAAAGRELNSLVAEATGDGIVFHMHTEPPWKQLENHPSLFDPQWGDQPAELFKHYRANKLSEPQPRGTPLPDFLRLVTPIGVVPKPASPGEIRPIFDARRSGCNACLLHVPIELATPERVLQLLTPGMWACSYDARHWYHQILVHPDSRKYQGYYDPFAHEFRTFRVAAFGGSTIPAYAQAVSTEAARQALECLERSTNGEVRADFRALDGRWDDAAPTGEHWAIIVVYLDDFIVFGSTRMACEAARRALAATLSRLGIQCKASKETDPAQSIRWIGMQYELRGEPVMSLPRDKAEAYMETVLDVTRTARCSVAALETLLGRLLWAARAWTWGGAFLKHLHTSLLAARAGEVALSAEAHAELAVWYAWLPHAALGIRQAQPVAVHAHTVVVPPSDSLAEGIATVTRAAQRIGRYKAVRVRTDNSRLQRTLKGAWAAPFDAQRQLVALARIAMARSLTIAVERETPAVAAPTRRPFSLLPAAAQIVDDVARDAGFARPTNDLFRPGHEEDPLTWMDRSEDSPTTVLLHPPFHLLEVLFAAANHWLASKTHRTAVAVIPWRPKATWFYRNLVAPSRRWAIAHVWFPQHRSANGDALFRREADGGRAAPPRFPVLVIVSPAAHGVDRTKEMHRRLAGWGQQHREQADRLHQMHR